MSMACRQRRPRAYYVRRRRRPSLRRLLRRLTTAGQPSERHTDVHLALSGFLFEDDYWRPSLSFSQFCALTRSARCAGVELRRTQVHTGAAARQPLAREYAWVLRHLWDEAAACRT